MTAPVYHCGCDWNLARVDGVMALDGPALELRTCPHGYTLSAELSPIPGRRLHELLAISCGLGVRPEATNPVAELQRRQRQVGDVILKTVEEMVEAARKGATWRGGVA